MDDTRWDREKIDYLTGKCVEHAWAKREKHFRAIGIESQSQLKEVIDKGLRDPAAQSFDRQPNPSLGQVERSQAFQIEHRDAQGKSHRLGVWLNPDLDKETGITEGGTVVIDDPKRRMNDFSRWLLEEHKQDRKPEVLRRGLDAGEAESRAPKSPISRLAGPFKREPTPIEKFQVRQRQQIQDQVPQIPKPPTLDR